MDHGTFDKHIVCFQNFQYDVYISRCIYTISDLMQENLLLSVFPGLEDDNEQDRHNERDPNELTNDQRTPNDRDEGSNNEWGQLHNERDR